MLRRRLLPALPLLLVLLGAVAPVRAADPLQNGNIAMLATGPAAARQGYYDLQAQPGDRVDLPFVISNPSGQPVKAILFAADAATADGGGMALRTPEDPVVAAGTWLSPGAGTYTLAPGQKLPVTLTLDVPRDARPGQHLALAIARVLEDGADPGQAGRDELTI